MDMKKTGAFIAACREEQGLSRFDLGCRLNVSEETVAQWEQGCKCPDQDQLSRMSPVLRCSICQLINGSRSESPADPCRGVPATQDYHRSVEVDFRLDSSDFISPLLFGDNLEHTRGCIYTGLSAQMLKNRKFAGKPTRFGWADRWQGIGDHAMFFLSQSYTKHGEGYRMNRSNECAAQTITSELPRRAGICQGGLYLTAGTEYEFIMVAKAFRPLTVTVRLESENGSVYDAQTLQVESGEFTEYRCALIPNAGDDRGVISVTFQEANSLTVGALSLLPRENFRGMRIDVIERMKELGIRVLRWPGGNFAGEYHWKDGLLPRDQRAPLLSHQGLETQPYSSGYDFHEINTDDYLALCRRIGAEPFITINPAWNTPEESAQWVQYCNGDVSTPYGALRARQGHPEPYNVRFFSLGNELGYGHMEGPNAPHEYSAVVREHAEKMLEVSPGLTLCSCGPYPHRQWADHSARPLRDVAPMVSLHHYAGFPEFIDPDRREQDYYETINKVHTEVIPKMQQTRQQLDDDRLRISFDEWNVWYAWYRRGSITEGIFAASFLNQLYMNAEKYGIDMACHFESVNEGGLLVLPDRVIMTPTGNAIASMRYHAGGSIACLQEDVVSTHKDGILTCTLINRSYDKPKCFRLARTGEVCRATVLHGDSILPNSSFREDALETVSEDGRLLAKLPPHSIAVVQFRL